MEADAPLTLDREKLEAFLKACSTGKPLYIMTHDHPDPDALASAAGVQYLIKQALDVKAKIVFGGLVGRPENRAMKSYLRAEYRRFSSDLFKRDITLIMVDAQPGAGNHRLPHGYKPAVVLDHHPLRKETRSCHFFDVRSSTGSCSTIVAGYLREAHIDIPKTLATALCYAITSETHDLGRDASEEDIETYVRLLKSANLRKLSRIEHSRAPREYFLNLHTAVENAFVYKNVIGSCLGRVSRPDLSAEIADLLLTHERMNWSICSVAFQDRLYISIRSTLKKARCSRLIHKVLGKNGSAGGHGMIAGGFLPLAGVKEEDIPGIERQLMLRFVRLIAPPGTEELPPLKFQNDH